MTSCVLRTGPLGELSGETFVQGTVAFESIAPAGSWTYPGGIGLPGRVLSGSYESVSAALNREPARPTALVLLFSRGAGTEAFLASIRERFRGIPCAGGAAARAEVNGWGFVFPQPADVVAVLLFSGAWSARTVHFHRPTGESFLVVPKTLQSFAEIEVEGVRKAARPFFDAIFEKRGIHDKAWDLCGLLDPGGRLLHLSASGEDIFCGTDLPSERMVEIALFDRSAGASELAGAVKPSSLVFACAGLYDLLDGPCLPAGDYACAHLYGEIVIAAEGPAFANLSVTILSPGVS